MTIPDGPAALTPHWLTHAIAGGVELGGASVVDVTMTPVGTGQMCDSLRIELRYDRPVSRDVPTTLFAKQPAADPQSRDAGRSLRIYEAEVRFYQELAPTLPLRTPQAYYADIDVETGSFILLLEDLAPARQGDQLAGCSLAEATLAVDELVKLHAPRWGDPNLQALDWLVRDPAAFRNMLQGALPTFWSGFCARYAERLDDQVHEAGSALVAGFDRYLDPPPLEHATVMHGDYRLDNLLFGQDAGVPIAVVDWQTVGHGPALTDVAYFIGAGLLPEPRRAHELDLVHRYHGALVAAGVRNYDWERCWADYRRGTFAGLVMAIVASNLVEQTSRGDDMFVTMAHRHALHALDLDAPALIVH